MPSSAPLPACTENRLRTLDHQESNTQAHTEIDFAFQPLRFEIATWFKTLNKPYLSRSTVELPVGVAVQRQFNQGASGNARVSTLVRAQLALEAPEKQDRVFDGMVRDFTQMYKALENVYQALVRFNKVADQFCSCMVDLAEAFVSGYNKRAEHIVVSDACKYKHAVSTMAVTSAPHSIVAKLKRDLDFNLTQPLQQHMECYRELQKQLARRTRRLHEYLYASTYLETLRQTEGSTQTDLESKVIQAEAKLKQTLDDFYQVDRPLFEWLYMLDEYKNDIYDSLLQTVKYLQYEFFAGCAHAVSRVLPKRMEFRPLVEMTPSQLEPLVEMELNNYLDRVKKDTLEFKGDDATAKILDRWQTNPKASIETSSAGILRQKKQDSSPIDPLCLSALTLQGFEAAAARNALQHHNNDVQSALECLLEKHDHTASDTRQQQVMENVLSSVRLPSTLKWVEKLRAQRASRCHEKTAHPVKTVDDNQEEQEGCTSLSPSFQRPSSEDNNLLILSPRHSPPLHSAITLSQDFDNSELKARQMIPRRPGLPGEQKQHDTNNQEDKDLLLMQTKTVKKLEQILHYAAEEPTEKATPPSNTSRTDDDTPEKAPSPMNLLDM